MKNEELDKIIEKSFGSEPRFKLSVDFAQKVTLAVGRREQWKSDLNEYLLLTAILLSLLSAVFGLYYYVDKEFVMRIFAFASGNIIQVVFSLFLLNFVLFADRVLLRLLFRSLPQPLRKRG